MTFCSLFDPLFSALILAYVCFNYFPYFLKFLSRIRLKLELYEKKEGKLGKITESSVRVDDIALQEILMSTLSDCVSVNCIVSHNIMYTTVHIHAHDERARVITGIKYRMHCSISILLSKSFTSVHWLIIVTTVGSVCMHGSSASFMPE